MVPQPWLIGVGKRSIERDYNFYDPPLRVWEKISRSTWEYKEREEFYETRDLALMCVLYLSTARISEIVRAKVKGGYSPSIQKKHFIDNARKNYLMLRRVPIFKRMRIEKMKDYPLRIEIPLPLKGGLTLFTDPIIKYLSLLEDEDELFKFMTKRAWTIVNHITGEFPHYLRDMGLKMWLRLFDMDIVRLQNFSGHKNIENLAKYLQSTWIESSRKILRMKLEDTSL